MTKNRNKENSGFVYAEIKSLLGDMEKIAGFMLKKTVEAEAMDLRDKAQGKMDHYRAMATENAHAALNAASTGMHRAAAHVRRCPMETLITTLAAGWLALRFFMLTRKH